MREVAIGDVCELINGRAFKPSDWSADGLPIVRIQNLNDENAPFNRYEGPVRERFLIDSGALLFSWSGTPGTSFGAFFWHRGPAILNQHIFHVLPRKGIDKNYLRYALNGRIEKIIAQAHGGVGLQHITKDKLEATTIPLPPFAEQRRIADILDKADAIRKKCKKVIVLTEDLLRSAFLEMFGDPVTNPKGWPVKPLGEVVRMFSGNSLPPGVEFAGQCDGYLLMKVGDMNLPGNEVELVAAREWAATVSSASVVAPAGAVVVPKRGGAIATNKKRILTRPTALDPNLMAVAPGSSLQLDYLRQWFEGIDLSRLSSGSAVPQLNKKDLAPLPLPVPSQQVQAEFADCAARIRAMRQREENALRDAEVLFAGLVAEAFSQRVEDDAC